MKDNASTKTEMCFRTPTVRQALGLKPTTFVFVVLVLFCGYILNLGFVYILLTQKSQDAKDALVILIVVVFLALPLGILGTWVGLLVFGKGRVLLTQESVIQYNYFNQKKVYGYKQIFEVKRGRYKNRTIISYYPLKGDGEIEYREMRRARLITVHRYREMRVALRRQIQGVRPEKSIQNKFMLGEVNGRLLVIIVVILTGLAVLMVMNNKY